MEVIMEFTLPRQWSDLVGWQIGLIVAVGAFVLLFVFFRIKHWRDNRAQRRRWDEESQEWERRRREAEEESRRQAEQKQRELLAATLYGEVGERLEEAAGRLGIELRHLTADAWLCRKGLNAFRAPLRGEERPTFYKIDPGEPIPVPEGAYYQDLKPWKLVDHIAVDKPYHRQSYDGDDFEWVTIAADQIGRRLRFADGSRTATWEHSWNPAGTEYLPRWEW